MVNCRVRITLIDGKYMIGQLLAYDKHMNLVVDDCEEFRSTKNKTKEDSKELRRSLGLVVIRGENVISLIPDEGFPKNSSNKTRIPASFLMGSSGSKILKGVPPINMSATLSGPTAGHYSSNPNMLNTQQIRKFYSLSIQLSEL